MKEIDKKPDLLELRLARDWTQQQTADRAGISRSYYCILEIKGRVPSINMAKKLAEVFHIDWQSFF